MSNRAENTSRPNASRYLRLHGGQVLTCDAERRSYDPGDVWIRGGEIVAVGPEGAFRPPDETAGVDTIDTGGRIVLPGLINGHAHSYAALLKGTVDVQPLDIYMLHVIAAGAGRTAREIYVSAMVDAITMLRSGTTSVIDHFSHRPAMTLEAIAAVLDAYLDSGIRAAVAPMFADLPYAQTIPLGGDDRPAASPSPSSRPDPATYFGIMEEALAHVAIRGDSRLQILLGVDGPQRCSPALLEMTADFQMRRGLGLHTHMLEARTQAVMAPPGGFIRQMCDLGILNERSSLVHFVWCSDADIAAAIEAGVTIVHVPMSNLHIGSGISPFLRLRRAGIPVAIGTDGANCGPSSMFEKLRVANLLSRVTEPDFEAWLSAEELWTGALSGGARALGKAGEIGILRPGARADLLVINPGTHLHRPMGDEVWSHLLYYENGSGVETVLVEGRALLLDGRLTTIDEDAVLAEAEEIVARHKRGRGEQREQIAAQYPLYRDMIKRAMQTPAVGDRLARI